MQHHRRRVSTFLISAILFPLFAARVSQAAAFDQTNTAPESPSRLKKLSLEELMNVEIISVSKKEQKVLDTPAAIHVITEEDIRRSGARSIPEALRLAPNLQVAQLDARQWLISARGFNGTFANKLLVMMDGRTLYTPLFSGVFWDVQDYLLNDLDRIEVVSGPGGTLWGANAVNGVINIITKSAKDTQGFLGTGGGGNENLGFGGLRYGGKLGENVYYRVYGKYFNTADSVLSTGANGEDSWHMGQGGVRLDWDIGEGNLLTVQGDGYDGRADQILGDDQSLTGGNILGRWTRSFSEDSKLQVQIYYDRTHRRIPGVYAEDLDTYDADAQYQFTLGERHSLLAGLGYRFTRNDVENTPGLAVLPAKLDRDLFSAFVQDEITLVEDRLKLTLGSKLEHNDYTGFEFQPSGRLAWTEGRHVVWGAISRAVRTPSRIDRHFFVPATGSVLQGGPGFDSEKLIAYELGYRVQPHEKVFASISGFYNMYDDIRSVRPVGSAPAGPFIIANDVVGDTFGTEVELTFQPIDSWRLTAGYTWLEERLHVKSGRTDLNRARGETIDPNQQFHLRSSLDLPFNMELDAIGRYVDTLRTATGLTVSSYIELDLSLGWAATENLRISIVGQNLLDNHHPEFPSKPQHEIERSIYGKITWRF
jgi:iron complex outermembrane receptor protein